MARAARYRPAASSDGVGNLELTARQFRDAARLAEEARAYALNFIREANTMSFVVGFPRYDTNRAFCFLIEGARLLAGGSPRRGVQMLKLALAELRTECSAKELDERGGERRLRAAGVRLTTISESEALEVERVGTALKEELSRRLREEYVRQFFLHAPAEPGVQ
jgi:hypothetical protein